MCPYFSSIIRMVPWRSLFVATIGVQVTRHLIDFPLRLTASRAASLHLKNDSYEKQGHIIIPSLDDVMKVPRSYGSCNSRHNLLLNSPILMMSRKMGCVPIFEGG